MNITKLETTVGGKKLTLETGKLAKQSHAVVAQMGETVVLATVVVGTKPSKFNFFPLKIDYDEKYYATGLIRPSRYMKRETRPSEKATLTGRFIDRTLRPLFPKGFKNEVQVILSVLSYDNECPSDMVASIAANAALKMSNAPFAGPSGIVRVGKDDSGLIINPNLEYLQDDKNLSLVVSSVEDRIVMLEGAANEMSEDDMFKAIQFGHEANQEIIKIINELDEKIGTEKMEVEIVEKDMDLYDEVDKLTREKIDPIFGDMDKMTRNDFIDDLKKEVSDALTENLETEEEKEEKAGIVSDYYDLSVKMVLQEKILDKGERVGGRGIDELRKIYIEVGLLPRTHGSSLFQRGETQALGVVTLSGPGNKLTVETMEGEKEERYFHHYNFPPFSVGDISTRRFTGNRELGHGALAEKAIRPMLPDAEEFCYTIRAVSEILESNGSSSMASTCCSSLALMNAGVPLKRPVAGVALGLMVNTKLEENDRDYVILQDLSDIEDFGGYMDFKVTGTTVGITAIQVDMKLQGVPMHVVENALSKALTGRGLILDKMNAVIPETSKMSSHAPRIVTVKIHPDTIRTVIGKGGETINGIIAETGVEIDITDEGIVSITSKTAEGSDAAIKIVKNLTRQLKAGDVLDGKVARLMDFGAIIDLMPGKDGLCHVSELADHHVKNVSDVCNVGDTVRVKIIETTPQGRISLSMKKAVGSELTE